MSQPLTLVSCLLCRHLIVLCSSIGDLLVDEKINASVAGIIIFRSCQAWVYIVVIPPIASCMRMTANCVIMSMVKTLTAVVYFGKQAISFIAESEFFFADNMMGQVNLLISVWVLRLRDCLKSFKLHKEHCWISCDIVLFSRVSCI